MFFGSILSLFSIISNVLSYISIPQTEENIYQTKDLEPQHNLYARTQKWTPVSNSDRFLQVLGILPVLITEDVVKKNAIFQILQHTNGRIGVL